MIHLIYIEGIDDARSVSNPHEFGDDDDLRRGFGFRGLVFNDAETNRIREDRSEIRRLLSEYGIDE